VALVACRPAEDEEESVVTSYVVTYSVTGTAPTANIKYVKILGGIVVSMEKFNVSVPWSEIITFPEGSFTYLSATSNQADQPGTDIIVTITYYERTLFDTEIYYEGILLNTATNTGDFVTATAMGYLPE